MHVHELVRPGHKVCVCVLLMRLWWDPWLNGNVFTASSACRMTDVRHLYVYDCNKTLCCKQEQQFLDQTLVGGLLYRRSSTVVQRKHRGYETLLCIWQLFRRSSESPASDFTPLKSAYLTFKLPSLENWQWHLKWGGRNALNCKHRALSHIT